MEDRPTGSVAPWLAAAADLAVLVAFVLIGRQSHHEDAGFGGFLRVWWPFAVGLLVGWLVGRVAGAPLAWARATVAWLLTVAVGMTLRIVVQGREFKLAFAIVTLVFLGAGMFGWRFAVRVRRARNRAPHAA